MHESHYTCCEDGMLSQQPPTDRSGLCPACRPMTAPTYRNVLCKLVAALDQPFRYPGEIEAALKPARALLAAGVKGLDQQTVPPQTPMGGSHG